MTSLTIDGPGGSGAAEQDEFADALGMMLGEQQGEQTAHRIADDIHAFSRQGIRKLE